MTDRDPLRPALAATILTGAILVAILAFTGGIWDTAPGERARAHLVHANGAAFSGLLAATVLYVCGLMGATTSRLHSSITNLMSTVVLIATIAIVSDQLRNAMDSWFMAPPVLPDGVFRMVHVLTFGAMAWLVVSVLFGLVATCLELFGGPSAERR